MLEVEKLILEPKTEKNSVGHPCNVDLDEKEPKKIRKSETESGGILHDVNTDEAENLISDLKTEVKSEEHLYDADENKTKNDSSSL